MIYSYILEFKAVIDQAHFEHLLTRSQAPTYRTGPTAQAHLFLDMFPDLDKALFV